MDFYTRVITSEARHILLGEWQEETSKNEIFFGFYKKIFQENGQTKEQSLDKLPEKKFFAVHLDLEELEIQKKMIDLLFKEKIFSFYVKEQDSEPSYSFWKTLYVEKEDYQKIKQIKISSFFKTPLISELIEQLNQKLGSLKKNGEQGKDFIYLADIPVPMTWWTKYQEITQKNTLYSFPKFITTLAEKCLDLGCIVD